LYFLRESPHRKDATSPTIDTAKPSPAMSEDEYGGDRSSSMLVPKETNVLIIKNIMISRRIKFLFLRPSFTVSQNVFFYL
jgi:hypothetical protein